MLCELTVSVPTLDMRMQQQVHWISDVSDQRCLPHRYAEGVVWVGHQLQSLSPYASWVNMTTMTILTPVRRTACAVTDRPSRFDKNHHHHHHPTCSDSDFNDYFVHKQEAMLLGLGLGARAIHSTAHQKGRRKHLTISRTTSGSVTKQTQFHWNKTAQSCRLVVVLAAISAATTAKYTESMLLQPLTSPYLGSPRMLIGPQEMRLSKLARRMKHLERWPPRPTQ